MGSAGAFAFAASGNPAPAFNVSGNPAPAFNVSGALPNGVNFAGGGLTGTPLAGSGGLYPLTVTATNVDGTNIQSFSLIVNEAPSITSTNRVTFGVGTNVSFTLKAGGYPPSIFSETGALPGGVSLNTNSGLLGGPVAVAAGASYPLVITASNGIAPNATQSFTLTTTNLPPVPGVIVLTTVKNAPLSVPVASLTAGSTDAYSLPLNIPAVNATSTNGSPVTLGGGNVGYTPAAGFTGRDQFTYTLTDSIGGTAQGTIIVLVTASAQPAYNTLAANYNRSLNQIQISFTGLPNQSYVVQSSATVTGPYADVPPGTDIVASSTGLVQATVTPVGAIDFFRIRTGP